MLRMTGLAFFLAATSFPGEVVFAATPHVEIEVGYRRRSADVDFARAPSDHIFLRGETVHVVSAIAGVPAGFVEHVWTREGKEVGRHVLPVGTGRRWRAWSHQKVKPGSYEIRVIGPDGTALGKTSFLVADPASFEDC